VPSFSGLLIVVAVAFAAPFLLGLFPSVRFPSVVLEIVAGIVIGPSVLGLVRVDPAMKSCLSSGSPSSCSSPASRSTSRGFEGVCSR